jgi:2-keto-3-deoxy-6-phosphogluconate aldolase
MPDVPLWVSGGVGIADIAAYLRVGVRVVGLTNDLFRPELISAHDWDGLGRLCRQALAAAESGVAVPA